MARHTLWLHKKGFHTLSGPRIVSICKTLAKHHSADVKGLVKQLQEVKKTNAMEPQPWKCKTCGIPHKASAEFCPKTGKHWTKAADMTFVPPVKKPSTPREKQKPWWEGGPSASSSSNTWNEGNAQPRKLSRKEKKEKNRLRKQTQETPFSDVGAWPAETPFPVAPSPFTTYASGAATQPPWQQAEKAIDAQTEETQEWVQALRTAFPDIEKMPPALRQKLDQTEMSVLRQSKSELHKATNGLYRAKSTLAQLLDARKKHQLAWCNHLQTAISNWTKQSTLYQQQQDDYVKRIAQAQEEIKHAQHTIGLLNLKASGAGPSPAEPETNFDFGAGDKELKDASKQLFDTLHTAIENVLPQQTEPQMIPSDEDSAERAAPLAQKRKLRDDEMEEKPAEASERTS